MNIVKSLHASLLHKCFSYQEKHFFTVSVLWGFRLTDGEPVVEQDIWSAISDVLGNGKVFDTGMPKTRAEFLVHGHCYARNDNPVPASKVSAELAGVKKELSVFGDRYWIKALGAAVGVSDPVPFIKMPISYSQAFGGQAYAKNPAGIGIDLVESEGEQLQPLPNVEYPGSLIGSPKDRPEPASLSRLDQMAEQRVKTAGTYDQRYIETRMPGFPDDLNMETFNDAATDQWLPQFPVGNEVYELINLHPQLTSIRGTLPAITGRCFVEHEVNDEIIFKEIDTKLDTIHFLPGADMGVLVHRGTIEINEDDAREIKKIIVSHENVSDEKRSLDHYRDQLEKRTDTKVSYQYMMDTKPLIPNGCKCGFKIIQENSEHSENVLMKENVETYKAGIKETAEKQQSEALSQQLDEYKRNGADTSAIEAELKKVKELSSVTAEDTPESKKIRDAVNKISPDINDPSAEFDFSKVDLKAIDELKTVLKEIEDEKKQDAIQQLKDQIVEARKNGFDKEADKLQYVLDSLQLPPVLPRVDKKALQAQVEDRRAEMDAELHKMQSMGMLDKAMLEKVDALHQQNLQQMNQAIDKLEESYRSGAHYIEKARSPHEGQEQDIAESLLNIYRSNGTASGGDYAFIDLSGQDLSGIDLSGAYLEYANLTDTNLTDANLENAVLSHAIIVNTKLTNARLRAANLGACEIKGADFTDADTDSLILQKSTITESRFTRCNFSDRMDLLLDASVKSVDFTAANMHKTAFIDMDFSDCGFIEADLSESSFVNPVMERATFDRANLSGVNFVTAKADKSSYKNSMMRNVRFVGGSVLNDTDFTSSDISESNLRDTELKNAVFTGARISKADFGQSDLRYANFDKVVGYQAQFNGADLEHASLQRADLMEGSLYKARISSASFLDASLYNVNFMGCTVGDTDFSGADLKMTIFKDWRP